MRHGLPAAAPRVSKVAFNGSSSTRCRETAAVQTMWRCSDLEYPAKQNRFGCVSTDMWISDSREVAVGRAGDADGCQHMTPCLQLGRDFRQCFTGDALDLSFDWLNAKLSLMPGQFHEFMMWLTCGRDGRVT
jgi:hypothetical protein